MTQFYLHGEVFSGWRLPPISSWVHGRPPSKNGVGRQHSKSSKTLGARRMSLRCYEDQLPAQGRLEHLGERLLVFLSGFRVPFESSHLRITPAGH